MSHENRPLGCSPFPPDASRQNDFLSVIVPRLTSLPWLAALWLGGSGARGDADRWSSVDLHFLLLARQELRLTPAHICALLDEIFPDGWTNFGVQSQLHSVSLEGLTHARPPAAADEGGVYFRLLWTEADALLLHRATHGPIHLLFVRDDLPDAQRALLTAPMPNLQKGEASTIQAGLSHFWRLLAHLPPAINREEHLAAAALLQQARLHLTDLVVALNGATRPPSPARINPYLGPAQQEAFEKSLHQTPDFAESWIGQAVALIVLYRWYAPQLVEIHNLVYPTALEETVLALLSAEVSGWPARITTA